MGGTLSHTPKDFFKLSLIVRFQGEERLLLSLLSVKILEVPTLTAAETILVEMGGSVSV